MADPAGKLVTPVAFRDAGTIHALEVSDDDYLRVIDVALQALLTALGDVATDEIRIRFVDQLADVEVVQQTPSDLMAATHGWDGAAWRKLPLTWGYSDRWVQPVQGAASGAGDASASTTAVAGGYVYVLQALHASHTAAANKSLSVYLHNGGAYIALLENLTAVPGTKYTWTGEAVLKEGDTVYAEVVAPGDTRIVYLRVWGYKMKIAE